MGEEERKSRPTRSEKKWYQGNMNASYILLFLIFYFSFFFSHVFFHYVPHTSLLEIHKRIPRIVFLFPPPPRPTKALGKQEK